MRKIILSIAFVFGAMVAMNAQSKELQQQKKPTLSTQNNTPIKQAPGTTNLEQQVVVDPVKVPVPVKNFVSEKYKNSRIQKASRNAQGVYQLEVMGRDNVVKTILVDETGKELHDKQPITH